MKAHSANANRSASAVRWQQFLAQLSVEARYSLKETRKCISQMTPYFPRTKTR
jgi:hypothetical protein